RLLHHYNSLSNKMDKSLLAVRNINHKYIVVERRSFFYAVHHQVCEMIGKMFFRSGCQNRKQRSRDEFS
ncbi:MAG: hypothetical protein KH010_24130, partial [Hungatella hathewayi]|nr:hypothetical protein [Hungatella hathewayi]